MGSLGTAFRLYRTYQSARSVLRTLGLVDQPALVARSSGAQVLTTMGLVVGGMLAGAGIALLFAPMTGRELRARIEDRAVDLVDPARPQRDDDGNGRSTWTRAD